MARGAVRAVWLLQAQQQQQQQPWTSSCLPMRVKSAGAEFGRSRELVEFAMTSRVPRKLLGRSMADSMSSSVDDDDNSLDGRSNNNNNNNVHGVDRRQSLDYANVYHSPTTVPKSEEKPRRRSSTTRPGYGAGDLMNHFNGSDPVRLELTRLENEVRGKANNLHHRC